MFFLTSRAFAPTLHSMDDFFENIVDTAVKQAGRAAKAGEIPVCAVVFDPAEKQIVATAVNRTERDNDPTAHAEVLAIRKACRAVKQTRLPDFDMYVTLEPCPMCAAAIAFARLRRLYFGAYDVKGGGVEHGCRVYEHAPHLSAPEVYGGIAQTRCAELLTGFFQTLRGGAK